MDEWLLAVNPAVGFLGSVVTLISALFAALAWLKARAVQREQESAKERASHPISLMLVKQSDSASRVRLPYTPRRDQTSRGEVLGILGLYYGGLYKFGPSVLAPVLERGEFARVLNGETDVLEMVLPDEDYDHYAQMLARRGAD